MIAGRRGILLVLLAAAALRIAFAIVFLPAPIGAIVPLDAEPYRALAEAVARGDFGHPGFEYLNPPYAFLIAPMTPLAPETGRAFITGLQIAMDLGVVALTYFVAARLFGRGVALGAAALYAFYGTAVFYSALVLPVTTSVLGLMLALAALLQARDRRAPFWLLPGAALGLFLLTRPNGIVLLPVVAWWMRRTSRRHAAFLAVGVLLALAPFSVRSLAHGSGPSPFPVNGGINFYIGNSEIAHGRYAHVPNVTDKPGEQVQTSMAEASRRARRPLDARGASSFWLREGLSWMAREPAAALRLTLRKAAMFFRAEEVPLNISYDFARAHVGLLRATVGLGLILALAFLGMGAAVARAGTRGNPDVWLVLGSVWAYAISVIAFFISDRYRIPIVPLLAIFAAHGASVLIGAGRGRDRRTLGLAGAAVIAGGVFAIHRFEALRYDRDGVDHVKLSDAYVSRGDYDRALDECHKAAAISPDIPDTLFCFATAYYFKKEPFRAEMSLRAAVAAQAGTFSDVPARRNLAHVLKEQQLFQEALALADEDQKQTLGAEYEDWKRKTGDFAAYARAQHEEGARLHAEGRPFEARYALRRAVEADPSRHEAWLALAEVSRALDLHADACAAARQGQALRPGDPRHAAATERSCR